jgi:capsular polysaccharide biosynthesis protein
VWVDQRSSQGSQQTNMAVSGEMFLTDHNVLQTVIPTLAHSIDSRLVAEETIRRLELRMDPSELLDNLTVEQVENTSFIVLTYKGTDPVQAKQIANTVGEVSSELISDRSAAGSKLRATVYEETRVPESPVSPNPLRNRLVTLVVGLALATLVGLAKLRPQERS